MSFTAAPHPLLSHLLQDAQVNALFSAEADVQTILRFELELAGAQAAMGLIPAVAARELARVLSAFKPDLQSLESAAERDGLVVPGLVSQLRTMLPEDLRASLHAGATSQDAIDTSLMLRARQAFQLIAAHLVNAKTQIEKLDSRFGDNALPSRTRMQVALPGKVSNRLHIWANSISAAQEAIAALQFPLQLAGPDGRLAAAGARTSELRNDLAHRLGLDVLSVSWQATRYPVVRLGNVASEICGAAGKIGQDIALMAQPELGEVRFTGGGTSSAMAHKSNPVAAEVLVSLAGFSATLAGGMQHALVHEQERSGAAWTLEFMLLPQLITTAGGSALRLERLLDSLTHMGTP